MSELTDYLLFNAFGMAVIVIWATDNPASQIMTAALMTACGH